MDISLTSAAAAGGILAGAAYLNARYGISRDLNQLHYDRKWFQRFNARVKELGDHTTIYHMMELCNPQDEALWFEGRTWSYDELKREVDALAEILLNQGVKAGDYVAIMMTNTPEMVFTIYALAKLGAAPAMVNTALRREYYFPSSASSFALPYGVYRETIDILQDDEQQKQSSHRQ